VLVSLLLFHCIADASLPDSSSGSGRVSVDESTAAIIKRYVRKYSREMTQCPPTEKTRLHFEIDKGRVENVRAGNACVTEQISRWKFPIFVGRVVVDYP